MTWPWPWNTHINEQTCNGRCLSVRCILALTNSLYQRVFAERAAETQIVLSITYGIKIHRPQAIFGKLIHLKLRINIILHEDLLILR